MRCIVGGLQAAVLMPGERCLLPREMHARLASETRCFVSFKEKRNSEAVYDSDFSSFRMSDVFFFFLFRTPKIEYAEKNGKHPNTVTKVAEAPRARAELTCTHSLRILYTLSSTLAQEQDYKVPLDTRLYNKMYTQPRTAAM